MHDNIVETLGDFYLDEVSEDWCRHSTTERRVRALNLKGRLFFRRLRGLLVIVRRRAALRRGLGGCLYYCAASLSGCPGTRLIARYLS